MNTPTVSHTTINDELRARLAAVINMIEDGSDKEVLRLHTNLKLELRGPDGELKDQRDIHNAVSFTGRNLILAASGGKLPAAFNYIAIGTGTTAPSGSPCTDTALGAEVARAAGTVTNSTAGTSSTQAVLQITYTFPAGVGTGTISEASLMDAASVGNLLARQTFGAVTKTSADSLAITFQVS